MNQSWHPVIGYEGLYEVSNLGNVRSVDRTTSVFRYGKTYQAKKRGKQLKLHADRGGYLTATLYNVSLGKNLKISVHILVAEAFIGPRPEGLDVLHGISGQKVNTPENLSYGSSSKNMLDRVRDGTDNRGEKHPHALLTRDEVEFIRRADRSRGKAQAIAEIFGISRDTVYKIRSGKTWSWLNVH